MHFGLGYYQTTASYYIILCLLFKTNAIPISSCVSDDRTRRLNKTDASEKNDHPNRYENDSISRSDGY